MESDPIPCVSRFISTSDFYAGVNSDLEAARESDDPETYGLSLENGNWACGTPNYSAETELSTSLLTVECTSWMPAEKNNLTEPAIYRFEAGTSYKVKGYVFSEDIAGVTSTLWVDFGSLSFNQAQALRLFSVISVLFLTANLI